MEKRSALLVLMILPYCNTVASDVLDFREIDNLQIISVFENTFIPEDIKQYNNLSISCYDKILLNLIDPFIPSKIKKNCFENRKLAIEGNGLKPENNYIVLRN